MANQNSTTPLALPSMSSNGGPVDDSDLISPQLRQLLGMSAAMDPNGAYAPLDSYPDLDDGSSDDDDLQDQIHQILGQQGVRSLDDRFKEYDQIDPIAPDLQNQADDAQAQYHAGVDPAAQAFSGLLKQGAPAFQPAHVSPWLVALGAGLGALQNGIEPHNQTGAQNWVAGPLAAAQQSAQDAYMRARQEYASKLDNAQAQYALSKDRNQTYLERAREIEDELREHAGRRADYVAKGILQDQKASQRQKAELLRQLFQSEHDRLQSESQQTHDRLSSLYDLRQGVVNHLLQQGDFASVVRMLHDDYMEGRPLNPDGGPSHPHDAEALQHLHGSAMNSSPEALGEALGRRVHELTSQQAKIHADSIRRQVGRLQRIAGQTFVPAGGN